ncbi:PLP-dependent aminotransferase family protein [Ammoniphilus sp. CFH 90114]|uniref:aminotransferase-like domain-containing protein n=1 Tax=Ammoniphilus sp. CFH 90114 TaxID=2493665 RepID=UPI00100F29B5|nr:PLP-dependent aminotransferase family protein [Ammoniphilus sp. CFH 90114]RXT07801.1 PLP-dependent aminotransferase family protein [Ammoniphilus sp. CFH 90114]
MRYPFADRVKMFKSSAVRELLSIIQQGDVISFAGGLPFEDYFPIGEVEKAYQKVFASGKSSLQYGLTEGYLPLRSWLSDSMKTKGIESKADNILLTTGSQQAIDLFTRVMISPGDVILTENPTYLAAIQVFQSFEAQIVPVDGDKDGMDPEDLEQKMKKLRPKFVYVVPTFSNPEGKVWSNERREHLLKLAYKYNVLIFEDDPYGEIQFKQDQTYTPLAAMDEGRTHVMYTSTFSKTVVPALRTGWVTGPYQVIRMMAQAKQCADLHSSSLDQQALYYLVEDFDLKGHIEMLRVEYYQRMTIMQDYLKSIPTSSISWVEPQGGMFLWVTLDEQVDTTQLLMEAVKNGVAFVPGAPFYVGNPQLNTLRLNFTHSTPEKIKLGMDRLALVLSKLQSGTESPIIV